LKKLKSRNNPAKDTAAERFQEERWRKFKKQQSSTGDEFFKGVGFCVGREGSELYVKAIERLGLYVSTQFKNERQGSTERKKK